MDPLLSRGFFCFCWLKLGHVFVFGPRWGRETSQATRTVDPQQRQGVTRSLDL